MLKIKQKEERKKQNNKERGITLIALVITIIVLLILAGVTIATLFGDNGIITKALEAKQKTEEAAKREQQQLAGIFGKNYADYNGQLHVEDGKLLNQYNEQIQLNGLYYGYGNSEYTEALLTTLKNKGVNLIKIGYNYSGGIEPYNKEGNMEKMYSLIDQLLKMNFYIDIIYWSDSNLNTLSSEAIDYFTQIANKYPNNEQILYEICNEPFENTWEEISTYANSVIPKIREVSPNAVISTPFSSNNFNEELFTNLLDFENLMYVTHIYAGDLNAVKGLNMAIMDYNVPVFISEWSNVDSKGEREDKELTDNLIYIINQNKIANSAWYFDESNTWQSDLSMIKYDSWGKVLNSGEIKEEDLGSAGKYYFNFIQGENKGTKREYLINYYYESEKYYEDILFWEEEYRTNITKIIFENKIDIPDTAIKTWDASDDGSKSIIAYIIDDGNNNGTYELHICGKNKKVKLISLFYTFAGFSKLEYINLNQLDTTTVKDMNSMFSGDVNLRTIVGIENIDTSNVDDMNAMFFQCINLESINLSNFDTLNVTNMGSMFYYCESLKEIDLKTFDTSNVTNMSRMFQSCKQLEQINFGNMNTSKVADMSYMFYDCNNLNSLDLSVFNTSNVTNMYAMFNGTGRNSSNFELILGEKFDTSNVTNMETMFQLTGNANSNFSLDLTSFTFRDNLNYTNIFAYLEPTVTIYVKDEEMQQFVINARGENVWSTNNVIIK